MQRKTLLAFVGVGLAAFLAGNWTDSIRRVKADSIETPHIEVQAIRGDTGLTLYYPSLNKLFVYQTPFVGLPSWGCSYSIQLSTPGGKINRQPCPN